MAAILAGRWRVPLLLFFTLLLFTWQYTTLNPADRGSIRSGDIDSQYYSLARWMSIRLAQGELPLWNRDVFGGSPFLAEPQAAALYPPRWATLAVGILLNGANGLPFWLFEVEIFAHLFIASLLSYGFLRRLNVVRSAAFLGAVIFAYSGPLTTYALEQVSIVEATVWLPGVLWGVEQGVRGSRRGWLLASLCLALSFLAGSTQITLYIGYAALAYALWRGRQQQVAWRSLVLSVGGWIGVTAGLVLAQAVPTLELTRLSPRATSTFAAMSNGLGFSDLIELFLPHATTIHAALYIGLLPFTLAAIPVALVWRQGNAGHKNLLESLPFWVGLALVALVFAFGGGSAFFGWLYQLVPGVALFRSQERVLFLFAFALATLAAFGAHLLLDATGDVLKSRGRIAGGMGVASVFLLIGMMYAYFTAHPTLPGWAFALLMAVLATLLLAAPPIMARQWIAVALLLILIDLFTVHGRTAWQHRLPEEHEEVPGLVESLPRDPHTTLLDVESGVHANIGALLGVPAVRGASPLRLATYESLLNTLPRLRWWALWGVTHVATSQNEVGVPTTLLGESTVNDTPHYLLQLNTPTSRVQLRYQYQVEPSEAERRRLLLSDSAPLLLETAPPIEVNTAGTGQISRLAIGHESWEVEITTDQPTLVRLALPYYSGWEARVDGQATALLRADTLWSAVAVPTGTHTLTLHFMPWAWLVAALISAVVWVVVLVLFIKNPVPVP